MIYSTVTVSLIFAAAVWFIIRLINQAGIAFPKNRALSFLLADKSRISDNETVTSREYVKIFVYALVFRVIVFLLGYLARGIFQNGEAISLMEYANNWNLWDAPHYLEIAQNGYANHIENGKYLFLVFFPLYPVLVRIFHFIIPNYQIAALTVSALCFGAACTAAYRLVTMDYSKRIAKNAVIFMSIYPFAFFHGAIMTESLFILVTLLTFIAIRKHNYLAAGILGAFAALTRSVGVLMIIPAAAEWIQSEQPVLLMRERKWRTLGKRFLKLLPVLITISGLLIYLYINYSVTGDPFIFLTYQREHWSQSLQFFGKTAAMLWDRAVSGSDWGLNSALFTPAVISLPVLAAVILYSVRRTRSMYVVFMIVYYVFNASASWPLSINRYLACMLPMFWVAAEFTDTHKELEPIIIAVMAIGFGIYLTGYITIHQIM